MKIRFADKKIENKDTAIVSVKKQKQDETYKNQLGIFNIILGIENPKKINNRKFILLARKVISLAKKNKIKKLALNFSDFIFPSAKFNKEEIAEILAVNFWMANYEFIKYKEKPKNGWNFINQVTITGNISNSIKKSFEKGNIIGESINQCRELVNTPGIDLTPALLVKEIKKTIKNTPVKLKTLEDKDMKKLGMGGILGVGQGSSEPSKFIILNYNGAKKEKPIVLVGKAVTFDTGGINLKSADGIMGMHMDMSGGASVVSAITIAAKLKIKKNIIALIPSVENMPSGTSYRPGDILKTMSGKTIEIGNTDAEGRIILSDTLTYAEKYKPKIVIDVATLTGAAMVALGSRASAIFSSNEKYHKIFQNLGEKTGDYVWPFPLWEEYEEEVKGVFADVNNIGKFKRLGGAITAAAFLYQFAKKYPWVHIDIAPTMTNVEGDFLAKGAAGAPVRLLIKAIEEL